MPSWLSCFHKKMQQGFTKKLHNYFFRNYCNVQVSSTCEKHYKGSKLFFSYILLCLVVVYCNFIYAEFTMGNLYLKVIKLITFKYLTLSLKFHLHSEDKKKKKKFRKKWDLEFTLTLMHLKKKLYLLNIHVPAILIWIRTGYTSYFLPKERLWKGYDFLVDGQKFFNQLVPNDIRTYENI